MVAVGVGVAVGVWVVVAVGIVVAVGVGVVVAVDVGVVVGVGVAVAVVVEITVGVAVVVVTLKGGRDMDDARKPTGELESAVTTARDALGDLAMSAQLVALQLHVGGKIDLQPLTRGS